jgi:chromosome partitioning protein
MQIIVLASRKGGAGKTTMASHLACEAERCGHGPVALADTDEMQGLAQWWDQRKANSPKLVRLTGTPRATADALAREGFRLLIIDTPPALTPAVADLVAHADLVIVPVQPSPDDLRAIGSTVDLVNRERKPMVFVVNRTKPRARLTSEAAIALSQHGTVAPVMVADRTDYAAAKIDGRTAPELVPGGPAAKEMADLWSYIAGRLEMAR